MNIVIAHISYPHVTIKITFSSFHTLYPESTGLITAIEATWVQLQYFYSKVEHPIDPECTPQITPGYPVLQPELSPGYK